MNQIRIGDLLYEPSIMYKRVIEHKVVDMYMEQYISGWGTIIVTESYLGRASKFASDITKWYPTKEEAEHEFIRRIHQTGPWE